MENYQLEYLINFQASYNGDLGNLQKNTKFSKHILRGLNSYNIINNSQFEEYYNKVLEYFIKEIKKVLESPTYYI